MDVISQSCVLAGRGEFVVFLIPKTRTGGKPAFQPTLGSGEQKQENPTHGAGRGSHQRLPSETNKKQEGIMSFCAPLGKLAL